MSLLTVIMPAYNAAKYIEQTLDSFIKQNFEDWQLIVIDDASADATSEIIQKWNAKDSRISLMRNDENLQVAKTMNKGIHLVASPYFARVDSDDVLLPNHFEKIITFLEQNKEIDLCGSQVITIDSHGDFRRKWNYETESDSIKISSIFACPFLQSSVVMRSTVIKAVNGYRSDMELIEDYELWIRILKNYKAANIPDYTIQYRIHDANMSEVNKPKILKVLEGMYTENCSFYPIDPSNLLWHAKMEVGEWGQFVAADFKLLYSWKKKLIKINNQQGIYKKSIYKNILDKYFTNAYLKIATQNKRLVRYRALFNAVLDIQNFIFILKRKKENNRAAL